MLYVRSDVLSGMYASMRYQEETHVDNERDSSDILPLPRVAMSRRRMIGTSAGAVAGAAVITAGISQSGVAAQTELGGTPAASPVAEEEAASLYEASGTSAGPIPLGEAIPPEYGVPTNWPGENYDLTNSRFVTESGISQATTAEIGLAWTYALTTPGFFGPVTSAPIVVGDNIYVIDMQSNVHALNKTTGEVVWVKEYNVNCAGPNGLGAGYGFIAVPLSDTAEVALLDAATGEEKWRVQIPQPRGEGITVAPAIYDSTVYVSTVPINGTYGLYVGGQRGVIYALDINDGDIIWLFDTTTDNLWNNFRVNSGGGFWHPPSFDENGNLFVAVANAGPYPGTADFPAGSSRPGENAYANSLIKIDPNAGKLEWVVAVKPHDLFDLDNHLSPLFADVTIDGTETPVVVTTGKHGIVVGANRNTGEELWRRTVGVWQNADVMELPADDEEPIEVFPGVIGGVETPAAIANGVAYLPVVNNSAHYTGSTVVPTPFDTATGQVVAIDVTTGESVWDIEIPTAPLGGIVVVNDVVFTAGLDGLLRGFAVADGSQVFVYQLSSGVNAPIIAAGDYLYIAAGGPFNKSVDTFDPAPEQVAQLIALKIGGEIQVAPDPSQATPEDTSAGDGLTVEAIDISFNPKELTIPANTDVQVTITNAGVLQHDFVIDELGVATATLDGGQTEVVTINAVAGEYQYYCSIPGHKNAGMVGTLIVE